MTRTFEAPVAGGIVRVTCAGEPALSNRVQVAWRGASGQQGNFRVARVHWHGLLRVQAAYPGAR